MVRGFKVCKIEASGDLCSASYLAYSMIYKIGEVTKRHSGFGPLAVFETFEDAKLFLRDNFSDTEEFSIFSCEYTPSEDQELWKVSSFDGDLIYWECDLPKGTILADDITLLEEIK